jgi:phospholipid/cholesterol/gamma-HCH transport system substrate-binding protein
MKNKRVLVNLVFFAILFLVMVGWAINSIVSVSAVEHPYRLHAEFANAFGVGSNAEVTYRGVPYGAVTSVRRRVGGVQVNMLVKRTLHIPASATASVFRKSAVGEPYVDFEPPAGYLGGGPYLAHDAVVPEARTTVPLEFSELLRSASRLIAGIPPEDVQTLLHEAAIGLDNRSDALRQLTESGDKLSQTLADRTSTLDRLLTNQTKLTHVVADHRNSLGQSITDLEQVSETLKNASANTQTVLDKGAPLITQAADLVAANKQNLDCDLKVLEMIVDETSTPRRLAELKTLLDKGPIAFNQLLAATDVEPDGRWVRVGLINNSTNPPKEYNPPKALPAVPAVPGCTSPLRAAAADTAVRPAASSTTLPMTPGALALLFGGELLASLVVIRLLGVGKMSPRD